MGNPQPSPDSGSWASKGSDVKDSTSAAEPVATNLDFGDVAVLGLAAAEVDRDIGAFTILALAFNICNSWIGMAGSMAIAIASGGTVTLLYGMLIALVVYLSTAATLAELAAVYPTAGGQYHFTSILAPSRFSRPLSYVCGMTSVFSWVALSAGVTISTSLTVIALAVLFNEDYVPHAWHYFLVFQCLAFIIFLYNVYVLKRTPWVHDIGFCLTIAAFFIILITCVSRSESKQSNEFVWTTFINTSGWPDGVCFLTGLVTPCFMFAGLDAALHLAEECSNPARTVPKAIMASVVIGFTTAFSFGIAMLYSLTNFDAVLASPTGLPIVEIYLQATRSRGAAAAFCVASIVIGVVVINAVQQTSSRLIWAFARDNGFSYSDFLSRIHPKLQVPVWSLIANYVVVLLTGCIYVASSTAFNALIGTGVLLQQVSFAFPAGLLIYQKRSVKFLPRKVSFRLPSVLGWAANIIVVCFAAITFVFFQLPVVLPVTALNMNYSCVVIGCMMLFGLANWFIHARKHYNGPRISLDDVST